MDTIAIVIRPALKRGCCEGDTCRAALYNQLLYSIAWKTKQKKEYWYGTYKDICTVLLDDCWGQSKVIKEINALVKDGLLEQRRNPEKGWDQTRQYLFGKDQALRLKEMCDKQGICIVHHIGFPEDILHLLKITNAFDENTKCICQKQLLDFVNSTDASGKNNRAIPKNNSKNSSKNNPKNTASFPGSSGSETEQPPEDNISFFNKNNTHTKPDQTGYVRMYMRECLKTFRGDLSNDEYVSQAHDIYQQSDLSSINDFELAIDKAFRKAQIYSPTWAYFFEALEKSLKVVSNQPAEQA